MSSWSGFEEREPPPMSAEMFAAVVLARLRPVAGVEVAGRRGLQLDLVVHGAAFTTHLDHFYRRYRSRPDRLSELIGAFIAELENPGAPPAAADSFEQAAPHLMPLLISGAEWQSKREAGVHLLVRPLVQDLGIAVVIDEGAGVTYIQAETLPEWDVDIVSIFDAALANLRERAVALPVTTTGEGEGLLLIDRVSDGYAATRAILPARLEEWSQRVSGELVIGLPTHNLMLGMSLKHPELARLAAQVEQDARTADDRLLAHLLVYRGGVLQILEKE